MTQFEGKPITLNDVDKYEAVAIPLIYQVAPMRGAHNVDELLEKNPDLEIFVTKAINDTISSLVHSPRKPKTVLHALILADSLTLGQIAGRIHASPVKETKPHLERLLEAGIVQANPEHSERPQTYSLSKFALTAALGTRSL